jgi:ribulose bisphosphate carboxylase small subunit
MKYFDVYVDGVCLSQLTRGETNSQIKALVRKGYQIFDFRKKDMVMINMIDEDQAIAMVGEHQQ